MATGLSTIVGQLVGGALSQADIAGSSWRPVFLINVPVGVVALCCAGRLVPESRARRRRRLDVSGTTVLAAALVAVTVPLVQGRQAGWPFWCWACLAAIAPTGLAFVRVQRRVGSRGGEPLVDPALFGRAPSWSGCAWCWSGTAL